LGEANNVSFSLHCTTPASTACGARNVKLKIH